MLDLADVDSAQESVAGAKIARLGDLRGRGWQVPDGYVVTADALRAWVPDTLRADLLRLLDDLPDDQAGLVAASARARALVEREPLPGGLRRAIRAAHARLEARTGHGEDLLVAVRSSSLAEDGSETSFAGQFDTYLGIRGADAVIDHVRRCWASLFNTHALGYRRQHGLPPDAGDLAVGVLQLVPARSSGVLFTLDPVTGDRDTVVIEANWGLGESVVSGRATPDHWAVDKRSGRILHRRVAAKTLHSAFDPAARRVVDQPVPPERVDAPCLDDEEIAYLCRRAVELEESEGVPQDVEWAIEDGRTLPDRVYVLQHRPETTWGDRPAPERKPFDPVAYSLRKVFGVPGA